MYYVSIYSSRLVCVLLCQAKERAPGSEIDGRKVRVDYSITERAHTPTPGIYLGKPTRLASDSAMCFGSTGN